MPISRVLAQQHVAFWERRLATSRAPYRSIWPRFLFRHEELNNAVRVLESGQLLSRAESRGFNDIAAGDVLAADHRAHTFARLYFRPRTPTQYHIEGIKKPHEIYHGAHAPVLVMLVFDAPTVLAAEGTYFSNGNMQSPGTSYQDDEIFFSNIPFDGVYHVGAFSPVDRDRIVRARCAEVLAASPMPLSTSLRAVVCRSPAERAYLLDRLSPASQAAYARHIVSQNEPGIFEHSRAYVETVDASREGFRLKFHPRSDALNCTIAASVQTDGRIVWRGQAEDADISKIWSIPVALEPGLHRCEVQIDGCLAYSANHLIDELPF